jgi:ATP-dependent Clp protease adapter protein ClpS
MNEVAEKLDVGKIDIEEPEVETSNTPKKGVSVVIMNDDITPMNCVVTVLRIVFGLDYKQSKETMNMAHTSGSALVGIYPEKEAEELLQKVDIMNIIQGYPLRCIIIDMPN